MLLFAVGRHQVFDHVGLPASAALLSSLDTVARFHFRIFCLVSLVNVRLEWARSRIDCVGAGLTRELMDQPTLTRQALCDELSHQWMQVDGIQLADIAKAVLDVELLELVLRIYILGAQGHLLGL